MTRSCCARRRTERASAASGLASRAVRGGHDQADMAARQHQNRGGPVAPRAVECHELRVEDREELMVAPVHMVGHPAAVALAREGEHALDPVPVSLDDNLFLAVLHGGAI